MVTHLSAEQRQLALRLRASVARDGSSYYDRGHPARDTGQP
jgi:hypothetical protein